MDTFKMLESSVRSYCRSFPTVFNKAEGACLTDEGGRRYIDFLSGAGSLNYGHNNPALRDRLISYLQAGGPVHGLDMSTTAKRDFLEVFRDNILFPREMEYKVQFPGPTGTNAVEAAFKLARKVTGRTNIISFTNGFHGVTLGSVAATGNSFYRDGAAAPLSNTSFMPYDGFLGAEADTIEYLRKFLQDSSSGVDLPAAVIVETVQGEGGVNVARMEWLEALERVCREFEVLLILDDIQVGCGRTGPFFSFEEAGITPDIVVLSKSLSGFGLPFSVVLMKPHLDQWKPGEHNGTFRGNNLAFVTAAETLRRYWGTPEDLTPEVLWKGEMLEAGMERIVQAHPDVGLVSRGRGMIWALDCRLSELASKVSRRAFERGLIIETCGSEGQVAKALPSLLIEPEALEEGLTILAGSVEEVLERDPALRRAALAEARA